jgi:hypothetical protein
MRVFEWNAQVSWKEPDVNSYEGKRCLVRLFYECPIPIYTGRIRRRREKGGYGWSIFTEFLMSSSVEHNTVNTVSSSSQPKNRVFFFC